MDSALDADVVVNHGQPMSGFVYMVKCADGSYYVGSTRALARRIDQHNAGLGAEYTKRRLPVVLVWAAEFEHIGEAFAMEKRIQGWSRAKREALIAADFDRLRILSKRGYRPSEHRDT